MLVNLDIIYVKNQDLDQVYDQKHNFSIKGVVKKMGVNLPCRVRLYEKLSGRLISEITTDNIGNYQFSGLARLQFFLVAHDPASQFNAVIQDNVVPK